MLNLKVPKKSLGMCLDKMGHSSSPFISREDTFQDSQWMPKTADSVNPIYTTAFR